jgi:hypothetical protein
MSERFGIPDHAPHQFQGMKEFLIRSTMNCVASINGMIARRTAQVVDNLRNQVVQQSERPFMLQLARDEALQAVCGVSFLAKGGPFGLSTISPPIPQSRCRGHVGLD